MKLRIAEDTCSVASKTSYMDSGLDANGIYYFGKKPEKPINWKDYKSKKNKKEQVVVSAKLRIKESEDTNNHYYYVMAWPSESMTNEPTLKRRFNVYDDAEEYYNSAVETMCPECYVRLFEYIDGNRVILKSTKEDDAE